VRDEVLTSRLRDFRSTIFAEMTALAVQTGALTLGQGFPDTDGPPELLAAAQEAIAGGLNQYPPAAGLPVLRRAVAAQRQREYGQSYDPDAEVLVTFGATEAISAAMLALCEPGDEVVVFEPYYDSYTAAIAMAAATRRVVLLERDGDTFGFDPDALRAAITPRTRILLLNTPHNPTGKVFTAAELDLIAGLCVERDLIALTDEVYEYLTYDGREHRSLASWPGMRERTLVISSAGKTFNATGWKTGWVCGPANLVAAVRTTKQFMTFSGGGPFQAAVAAVLAEPRPWVDELRGRLQSGRDILAGALRAAGVPTTTAQGSYFLQFDARSFGETDGVTLCQLLPRRAGVVAIPAVVFYDTRAAGRSLVRLAFCKRPEVLVEGGRRLAALAADAPASAEVEGPGLVSQQ
jgi:N-succinyldiaminopimelate aminotransferase